MDKSQNVTSIYKSTSQGIMLRNRGNKENHKIQTAHLRTIEDQLHCSLYLIPNGVNKHISRVSQMTQVDFNLIALANLNYFNARA